MNGAHLCTLAFFHHLALSLYALLRRNKRLNSKMQESKSWKELCVHKNRSFFLVWSFLGKNVNSDIFVTFPSASPTACRKVEVSPIQKLKKKKKKIKQTRKSRKMRKLKEIRLTKFHIFSLWLTTNNFSALSHFVATILTKTKKTTRRKDSFLRIAQWAFARPTMDHCYLLQVQKNK